MQHPIGLVVPVSSNGIPDRPCPKVGWRARGHSTPDVVPVDIHRLRKSCQRDPQSLFVVLEQLMTFNRFVQITPPAHFRAVSNYIDIKKVF